MLPRLVIRVTLLHHYYFIQNEKRDQGHPKKLNNLLKVIEIVVDASVPKTQTQLASMCCF